MKTINTLFLFHVLTLINKQPALTLIVKFNLMHQYFPKIKIKESKEKEFKKVSNDDRWLSYRFWVCRRIKFLESFHFLTIYCWVCNWKPKLYAKQYDFHSPYCSHYQFIIHACQCQCCPHFICLHPTPIEIVLAPGRKSLSIVYGKIGGPKFKQQLFLLFCFYFSRLK